MNFDLYPLRGVWWRLTLILWGVTSLSAIGCSGPPAVPTPQRPTFAPTTQVTAAGTIEIEAGGEIDPDDRHGIPLTAKFGVSENSEVFVSWSPYQFENRDGDDGEGMGDTVIGMRERMIDLGPDSPSIAYQLKTKLPTASERRGLGTGEIDFFAGVVLERPWRESMVAGFYQLGVLGDPEGGDPDLQHAISIAARGSFSESLRLFAEVVGIITPEQDLEEVTTTAGFTIPGSDGWIFDLGCSLGLTEDAPDFSLMFGLTVNLGGIGTE